MSVIVPVATPEQAADRRAASHPTTEAGVATARFAIAASAEIVDVIGAVACGLSVFFAGQTTLTVSTTIESSVGVASSRRSKVSV